ncbi:hypothetical protein TPA0909_19010 [Streptomyces albus]|nr:hypothetical protein TPA0909_19010 [Streptomyces albus]
MTSRFDRWRPGARACACAQTAGSGQVPEAPRPAAPPRITAPTECAISMELARQYYISMELARQYYAKDT